EVRVFVIHVLDAVFLEAAVLVARVNGLIAVVAVVVAVILRSHRNCLLRGLLSGCLGRLGLGLVHFTIAAALVVGHRVLIEHGGQKADNAFVAAESQLEYVYDVTLAAVIVSQREVVTSGFLLNWVSQLAQAPGFSRNEVGAIFLKHLRELLDRLLHLALVQYGGEDEDRLVISYVH
nr:hypothetical protein [Tanacetum cinerariifolium]